MDMRTAAGTFKKAADEDFIAEQNCSANRANAIPFSAEAVDTALYMHEPVFAAVQGGEGGGAYQFVVVEFGGTYRAGLRIARCTFSPWLQAVTFPGSDSKGWQAVVEKKSISKPEQEGSDYCKNQNLKNIVHVLARK